MYKALLKKKSTNDGIFQSIKNNHSQHKNCNKLCLAITLTELIDIYRQKITQVEHIYKNKLEVRELPTLLEN